MKLSSCTSLCQGRWRPKDCIGLSSASRTHVVCEHEPDAPSFYAEYFTVKSNDESQLWWPSLGRWMQEGQEGVQGQPGALWAVHNKKVVVNKTGLLFGHFLTCKIKHVISKSVRRKLERAVDSRGKKDQDRRGRQSQEDWAIFRGVLKHLVSKAWVSQPGWISKAQCCVALGFGLIFLSPFGSLAHQWHQSWDGTCYFVFSEPVLSSFGDVLWR